MVKELGSDEPTVGFAPFCVSNFALRAFRACKRRIEIARTLSLHPGPLRRPISRANYPLAEPNDPFASARRSPATMYRSARHSILTDERLRIGTVEIEGVA